MEISLEIITTKFSGATIVEMSQTQLPTNKMQEQSAQKITQQIQQMVQQAQQATQNPQLMQQAQQNPQMAQQLMEKVQQQMQASQKELEKIQQQPTIDQVLRFLKDSRAKSFRARYRNRFHHHAGRERRKAAAHRVHAGARRPAATALAHDRGRAADRIVRR